MRSAKSVAKIIRILEDDSADLNAKIDCLKKAEENGDITYREVLDLTTEYFGHAPQRVLNGAEAFYTGGDIWMSAMYLNENIYCEINSDVDDICDDAIWYHDNREDDPDADMSFPCQSDIGAKAYSDLAPDEMDIYWELRDELVKTAWW